MFVDDLNQGWLAADFKSLLGLERKNQDLFTSINVVAKVLVHPVTEFSDK